MASQSSDARGYAVERNARDAKSVEELLPVTRNFIKVCHDAPEMAMFMIDYSCEQSVLT